MSGCAVNPSQNKAKTQVESVLASPQYVLGDEGLSVCVVTQIDPSTDTFAQWGQRFDRTAVVTDITFAGHTMVNQLGLPDEFGQLGVGVLGFDDARPGESFIKPGVAVFRKPDTHAYRSSNVYEVVSLIASKVTAGDNQLTVQQTSPIVRGYGYHMVKTYRVDVELGRLVITYELTNTGKHRFEFEHYNHNFLTLDNQPFGERYHITLGKPVASLPHSWMHMAGNRLVIEGDPGAVGFVQVNESMTAIQADLRIESASGRLGVRLTGSHPAYRFAHFFTANSYSPERFTRVQLEPQASATWQACYDFYTTMP
ncbi:MAG TPA: hypothetical protein DER01_10105 [Phycisphaerales bacterium]|nr:hypothetical protein [Phycisphaerales bacterium]